MAMTDSPHQPSAGKPPLGPRKALVAVAIALAVGAILVLLSQVSIGPDADGAATMCEEYVTDRLKAPATADFPGGAHVSSTADEWTVVASVDSENGFGAMIRTDYVCTVRDISGKWDLVSLDMDD
jgi:hypothetical protein